MKLLRPRLPKVLKQIHRDRRGAVSLETILILGAIALPILIYIIKFGWPMVKDYFFKGMETLEDNTDSMINDGNS